MHPAEDALAQNQIAARITEFYVALNSSTLVASVIRLRLQQAQLALNITEPIPSAPPSTIVPAKLPSNHAYEVLKKLKIT